MPNAPPHSLPCPGRLFWQSLTEGIYRVIPSVKGREVMAISIVGTLSMDGAGNG
jgi:hypothetical protein